MVSIPKVALPLALLCVSLPACATPDAVVAAKPPEPEEQVAPAEATDDGTIKISKSIQEACGLSSHEAHFRYNSAAIQGSDGGVLAELATCFTSGPLADEDMSLVGRADPRGEDEYNRLLGGRRGDSVKTRLVKEGMSPNQILVSSRGELDATGFDEASWVEDRRVDVSRGSGS